MESSKKVPETQPPNFQAISNKKTEPKKLEKLISTLVKPRLTITSFIKKIGSIKIKPIRFPFSKKEPALNKGTSVTKSEAPTVTKSVTFSFAPSPEGGADPKPPIKFSSSNVGADAGLGTFATEIKKHGSSEVYLREYLKLFLDMRNKLDMIKDPTVSQFLKDTAKFEEKLKKNTLTSENFLVKEKELVSKLVNFLDKKENRKNLIESAQFGDRDLTGELSKLNTAIYSFHDFIQLKDEHNNLLQEGAKNGNKSPSFEEHVIKKNEAITGERYTQLNQEDVGFLQEFSKEKDGSRIDSEKFHVFSTSSQSPSLLLNKKRFEVFKNVKVPGIDLDKISKKTRYEDFEKTKSLGDFKEIKIDGIGIEINDDGSFQSVSGELMGTIAKDQATGNVVLFCSIHLQGYNIADDMQTKEATKSLQKLLPIIEKFANENGASGIVMGGDFNTVEEKLTKVDSPMEEVKNAQYTPIDITSYTNLSPPRFIQKVELARKIDYIFYKVINVAGGEFASAGIVRGDVGDSLHQHERVFDHETISAEIKLPSQSKELRAKRAEASREEQLTKAKVNYLIKKQEMEELENKISSPMVIEQASSSTYRNLIKEKEEKEVSVDASYQQFLDAQQELEQEEMKTSYQQFLDAQKGLEEEIKRERKPLS